MILMHRAALGGVQLDQVDSKIMVKGVSTSAPKENDITAQVAGNGLRFVRKKRESLEVNIRIGLRLFDDDMDGREELMEKVCAWARNLPAWLTTDQKPGRRLWVESVKTPAPGDPAEWTNEFTFTFTAMSLPWWEDANATSVTIAQDDEGEGTLTMPGSTDTVADFTVQNKSGDTINTLTLSANGTSFSFTGLGLVNNAYLTIDHVQVKGTNVLRARIGEASKLLNMSGDDDIILHPGANTISFGAGGDVIVTVSARGRYQ